AIADIPVIFSAIEHSYLISVQGKGKLAFPADSTVDIDGLELEFQALVVNTADICPDVGIAGCPGKLPSHQHIRGVGSVSINRSGYSILQDPEVYAHIVRSSCLPGQVDIAQRARVESYSRILSIYILSGSHTRQTGIPSDTLVAVFAPRGSELQVQIGALEESFL